jgi:hypothetical protein
MCLCVVLALVAVVCVIGVGHADRSGAHGYLPSGPVGHGTGTSSTRTPAAQPTGGSTDPIDETHGSGADVADLDPALRRAVDAAIRTAKADGVLLYVNSGYRTRSYQEQLYQQAIDQYGSPQAARKWVLPPDESSHTKGLAVDMAPLAGAAWLRREGIRFGLCQRYANEGWHFELLAAAPGSRCPEMQPTP